MKLDTTNKNNWPSNLVFFTLRMNFFALLIQTSLTLSIKFLNYCIILEISHLLLVSNSTLVNFKLLIYLITARSLCSVLKIKSSEFFLNNILEKIKYNIKSMSKSFKNRVEAQSFFSREIQFIPDGVFILVDIFSGIISIMYGLTLFNRNEIHENQIAIFSFLIFVIISIIISKKRIKLNQLIYNVSYSRINKVSQWPNFRELLNSWRLSNIVIEKLSSDAKNEIENRNRDSIFRSFEIYFMLFGKGIPIIFSLLFLYFTKGNVEKSPEKFWISLLVISELMSITRTLPFIKNSLTSYLNIKNKIPSEIEKIDLLKSENEINFNDKWDLQDDTLIENVFSEDAFEYLEDLELISEFNLNSNNWKKFKLNLNENNFSEGQKTKIL